MKEILKPKKHFYKVYDKNGSLKRIIEKKQEKQLSDDEHLKVVTCFVINEKGEILIERRVNKGIDPGKLDLCSGHVEYNETPTQAIIRELREELGIQIEESTNVIKINDEGILLKFEGINMLTYFYCLKRNKSDVVIQKEEIDEAFYVLRNYCYELIMTMQTRFPKYDYNKIFEKVEDICNNKDRCNISRE